MIKSALAATLLFFTFGSAASATASIFCAAGDDAYVRITIGAVSSIVGVDIEIGDVSLSTIVDRGEQVALLYSFVDADSISIDLSDPNAEKIIAQIRLFTASYDDEQAIAGTLWVDETGVYPLVCEGP